MPAGPKCGCAGFVAPEAHHCDGQGGSKYDPPRFRFAVARPEPSRVLHSTHAPASLLDGPSGVRYHTARAVVPYGEATVTVKMICPGSAALPAPALTLSMP